MLLRKMVARGISLRLLLVILAVAIVVAALLFLLTRYLSRDPISLNFGKSVLQGASSEFATSLQFGPDGRLYVAQQDGVIKAYTVQREGANDYAVTETETIDGIQAIPNHDDDGSPNPDVTGRIITGILLTGTSGDPVIYATSSDPRTGGNTSGEDLNLDTNSSTVSRLTRENGGAWARQDLVRGLPRSEEKHMANGMQLDEATDTLYVTQGGNTNAGAPSNNFAFLPNYALSAGILEVDLDAVGEATYDLPTLDDEDRAGASDANDPFGGNDGKNQALLLEDGPVRLYASGLRNPYDLVFSESGEMYTVDNGANAGWGDLPVNEGSEGACTNEATEPGETDPNTLHLVSGEGYYGGHPNPTRGNTANTFNADEQSPVPAANPVECDYQVSGTQEGSLTSFDASTNGLAEYTASNYFDGVMQGDLLAASFDNSIYRVELSDAGDGVASERVLFSDVSTIPLDITTQGDDGVFPGTIWVADVATGAITIFEPNDDAVSAGACNPAGDPGSDSDGDGFGNADENDAGTNPCSAADAPPDKDADKVSDATDPDDDDDGLSDASDPFAVDPENGADLPVSYSLGNDAPDGGLLDTGFTGLMMNGSADYQSLFDPDEMTAGGAAGVITVDEVSDGDASGDDNTQRYAFQFGVNPPADGQPFTAYTRVLSPFAGLEPQDGQSLGLFVGTGDQDNYAKLVVSAGDGGQGGLLFSSEVDGSSTTRPRDPVSLPGPDAVDLYLTVDPAAGTVQPSYSVTTGGVAGPRTSLGGPAPIPAGWLHGDTGLAVGIISTSGGTAREFPATWDFIEVFSEQGYSSTRGSKTAP